MKGADTGAVSSQGERSQFCLKENRQSLEEVSAHGHGNKLFQPREAATKATHTNTQSDVRLHSPLMFISGGTPCETLSISPGVAVPKRDFSPGWTRRARQSYVTDHCKHSCRDLISSTYGYFGVTSVCS